jgi:predicted transcriptional regulator
MQIREDRVMPTSVRLDPKTERVVRSLARRTGRTRSQVIRDAIHRLAASEAEAPGSGHR